MRIFGGYTRWAADVPPPDASMPARVALTTVDAAFRHAVSPSAAGPVHLNLQFREPLAPSPAPWPASVLQVGPSYPSQPLLQNTHMLQFNTHVFVSMGSPYTLATASHRCYYAALQGLEQWQASSSPYTTPVLAPAAQHRPSQYLPQHQQEHVFEAWEGSSDAAMSELLGCLSCARRGLLVVAQLTQPQDCLAALRIAEALGWPIVADVLSGEHTCFFIA